MAAAIWEEIRKIPPVTRFLCASTLAVSVPVMLQIVSPYKVLFVKELVLRRFELWRPFTSLFYAGSGFSFLFDFMMLYRNSDSLESSYFAGNSGDYAWQLLMSVVGILALNIPLKSYLHFRPLLLSLIYVSSRLQPHGQVSIFGLITVGNFYAPFLMLFMDLVMSGPKGAASSLTGLIAGHAWWYLFHDESSGRPGLAFATCPSWLKLLIDGRSTPSAGQTNRRPYGAATASRPNPVQNAATSSGYNWGSGQRLGNS